MKNILVLTKRERRVVIAIVLALLAGRIAKYEWAAHSQPLRLNPRETAAAPPATPGRDESQSADETQ
ncbi:MAG: hypothetical protein DMF47_08700 [Verrucomicrobia bacterium]|nr:MAG: hypothetical protein DMF47_08700 [Verrucomicrobiota bacterium]